MANIINQSIKLTILVRSIKVMYDSIRYEVYFYTYENHKDATICSQNMTKNNAKIVRSVTVLCDKSLGLLYLFTTRAI